MFDTGRIRIGYVLRSASMLISGSHLISATTWRVSELPSEEVEVSEQSLEGVSDKGLEWREHAVVLGTAGRGSE